MGCEWRKIGGLLVQVSGWPIYFEAGSKLAKIDFKPLFFACLGMPLTPSPTDLCERADVFFGCCPPIFSIFEQGSLSSAPNTSRKNLWDLFYPGRLSPFVLLFSRRFIFSFPFFSHQIKRGAKTVKKVLAVMENLFYQKNVTRIFDLKGSLRSRYVEDESQVLLDENLLNSLFFFD